MALNEYIKSDGYAEEVAYVHLVNPDNGKNIDLVGAIHIGLPSYYTKVQEILDECDVVFYEGVAPPKRGRKIRDDFLFLDKVPLKQFYRKIAGAVSEYYRDSSVVIVESLPSEVCPALGDFLTISGDELAKEMALVCQGDAIDYGKLPENWYRADLTYDEVLSNMAIISKENLLFGVLKLISELTLRYKGVRHLIAGQITGGCLTRTTNIDISPSIMAPREEKVYERVDEFENGDKIEKMGVFYGVGHLRSLEKGLEKKGYKRDGIEYLEAIRKMPRDFDIIAQRVTERFVQN